MGQLQGFHYRNVELKGSHWNTQRSEVIETYLSIDNGDYLHYFRSLAGSSDSYKGLAGWYGRSAGTFGQILGAMAKLYRVTGEERIFQKAIELADGWGECAKTSAEVVDINGTYVYDKLMGGFLDMYEYLQYKPALEYIRLLTVSAQKRFQREIPRDGLQDEGMGRMIEWYTLPEQLYRAYFFTKDEMYFNFAGEWNYHYYWNKLAEKDFNIGPRHAYSHVNSLSSAAMAYLATKNEKYLKAVKNGYEEILTNHTFATGGYGPAECLFPSEEGYLGDSIKANWDRDKRNKQYLNFGNTIVERDDKWGSCEVSCCSWAVFKLCSYLLAITGEAKYGGWAEKLLYNGCGGQIPITKEGKVMYYADYFINGGLKSVEDGRLQNDGTSFEWQCCTGTFPEDVAEYSNMLYYQDENGLYVSQYLASAVYFSIGGKSYKLRNESFYPKEKQLKFTVDAMEEKEFVICFRVPSWAAGKNTVKVNGEIFQADAEPDTWLRIKRNWRDGDTIEIEFAFVLRFQAVDHYAPNVAALCYGPVVLVCSKMTDFTGDMANPQEWLEPIQKDGYSFAFCTKPGHVKPFQHLTREFYPYYEVPAMEWYYMYNRIDNE